MIIIEKTLLDYWLVLYQRKRTILIIILSAIFSAGMLSYFLPPVYQANAVFFPSSKPDTLTFLSQASSPEIKRTPLLPIANEEQQSVYLGILKSRKLIGLVSEKTGKTQHALARDTDFRISNEYLIELYSRDANPVLAANIANTYVEVFNDFLDSFSSGPASKNRIAIQDEINNVKRKLKKDEDELRRFKLNNRALFINEDASVIEREKVSMQMEIEKAKVSLKVNDDNIAKLEDMLAKEAKIYVSSPLIYSSPIIMRLQTQLSDIEVAMASLSVDIQGQHPDMMKLQNQYNKKKKELEIETKKIVESAAKSPDSFHEKIRQQLVNALVDRQSTQAKIKGLKVAIKNLDKLIESFPALQEEMDNLSRNVALQKNTLDNLRLQSEEIKAQERRKMQNVIVVSPAILPEAPVYPNIILNLIVAILLGSVTGIFYCFFMNYIETVKDPERRWK
ncbi:MAG: hypothetical protein IT393_05840 [Nitrospirae bacterium]|nr:hypothetical protein [Nitrospirota bacterium]